MGSKWIRRMVRGVSLTSALFVFQACYGTPQDLGFDLLIEGQVKSKTTGLPIPGIKVTIKDIGQWEFTDEEGRFGIYTLLTDAVTVQFQDVDSIENGNFNYQDTLLTTDREHVLLTIELTEKK